MLYAMHTDRSFPSQSNGFSSEIVASIANKVRLKRSTSPSDCEWYGVVRDLLMPSNLHTSAINSDSNCQNGFARVEKTERKIPP